MKYAIRLYSTMCGIESYIFTDTEKEAKTAFDNFQAFLEAEDDEAVKHWEDFVNAGYGKTVFDNEINDYSIGYTDDNQAVFVSDGKAIIFKLVIDYVDRF